eukprot:SAG11_NODE_143_length_14870_cov_6.472412_3_plen_57_part_00
MSVTVGECVELLESSHSDWWLVRRDDGKEGYVPARYINSQSVANDDVSVDTTMSEE